MPLTSPIYGTLYSSTHIPFAPFAQMSTVKKASNISIIMKVSSDLEDPLKVSQGHPEVCEPHRTIAVESHGTLRYTTCEAQED